MQSTSLREQQKRDRKDRIFNAAMRLFNEKGFQETTVVDIARAARVSRGTVFNYFPYKEAILIDDLAQKLDDMRGRVSGSSPTNPLEALYAIFDELASFAEANPNHILPLSYELLNPDPERSKHAFMSLPLVPFIYEFLTQARTQNLIRSDFSRERLARTIANTYFLTALQWAAYRQDRSIHDELKKALKLTLEGIVV
ncbi:MAG: TetR/AcrR family transcriptional regulator [Trueperaceae bacterium]|nr:TetR/AcrR family transcriptional regulator [Trueperaceae bacterium]